MQDNKSEENKIQPLNPFLKWPGGKRWFVKSFFNILPKKFNTYIEPFFGGGSVFFYLQPKQALISDINKDLINLYTIMRDMPIKLKTLMIKHQEKHSTEYFYLIRSKIFNDNLLNASRLLYLNRTCFNGMYRVNKSGHFNVPIGSKTKFLYDLDLFDTYSNVLKNATLFAKDFSITLNNSKENDFIFVDPPYTIAHNQNSFIKYNENLFSWKDQERLANDLNRARNRGAIVIATNANYKSIKELYSDLGFNTYVLNRYSSISGKSKYRKNQEELLITTINCRGVLK